MPPAVTAPNTVINQNDGFDVDLKAFTINGSGKLNPNDSNIPTQVTPLTIGPEGVENPALTGGGVAPNAVTYKLNPVSIQTQISNQIPGAKLEPGTVQANSVISLKQNPGAAAYGQQLTAIVYGPNGEIKSSQTIATAGDAVTVGPDGKPLPTAANMNVSYGIGDRLVLRAQNIRENGAKPSDSGIFVVAPDGKFQKLTVEDLQNGGDKDANDALMAGNLEAVGKALISNQYKTVETTPFVQESRSLAQQVTTGTDSRLRQQTTNWREETQKQFTQRDPLLGDINPNLLPHATQIGVNGGTTLLSSVKPNNAVQLSNGGGSLIFQTKPLTDPTNPPTILTGTVNFKPNAATGTTNLDATVTLNQFLTPTHATAIDPMTNRPIKDPNKPDNNALVTTGIGGNPNRLSGYVPAQPDQIVPGQRIASQNGVFTIPADKGIVIQPPDATKAGRGDSWFTDNVGGLIVERKDGSKTFVPQWTKAGFETKPMEFKPGEVKSITYALVPQQKGQDLQLGQTYPIANGKDGNYAIPNGATAAFRVISADRNPQNFAQFNPGVEVYGVEDTLPGVNANNLVQGQYRQKQGGALISTVDNTNPATADAKVGNNVVTPPTVIPGKPGQDPYLDPPQNVGGILLQGSLATGIGNRNVTSTTVTTSTGFQKTDTIRDTFGTTQVTPGINLTTTPGSTTVTNLFSQSSNVDFRINGQGEVTTGNVTPVGNPTLVSTSAATLLDPSKSTSQFVATGNPIRTETLLSSEQLSSSIRVTDQTVSAKQSRSTEVGFAPVTGELSMNYVQNLGGNTAWSNASNQVMVGGYIKGVVAGDPTGTSTEYGARAKLVLNPFGEEQKPAFNVSSDGKITPIYKTKPVLDGNGKPVMSTITTPDGRKLEVQVNEFVRDDKGALVPETRGTGQSLGPPIFGELRVDQKGNLKLQAGVEIRF